MPNDGRSGAGYAFVTTRMRTGDVLTDGCGGLAAAAKVRAGCRIRTDDIFLTREALYQLS